MKKRMIRIKWNEDNVQTKLIADKLTLEAKNILIKEHIAKSYVVAYTTIGKFKVKFSGEAEDNLFIEQITQM